MHGFLNRFTFVLRISISIDLGRFSIFVPEPLCYKFQRHSMLVQMHSSRMTPHMRMYMIRNLRTFISGDISIFVDALPNSLCAHLMLLRFVLHIEKKGRRSKRHSSVKFSKILFENRHCLL